MTENIEIVVNGLKEEVPRQATIAYLVRYYNEEDNHLIVEHNHQFVYPQDYERTIVTEGDEIEFINPNFGG